MILDMSIKELRRRKTRTLLTIVGIAIGILLVTTLSSFSEGINSIINTELSYLSSMVMVLQEGTGWGNFQLSEMDESIGDDLAGISGVDRVGGMVMGSVPEVGMIYGADPDSFDMFDFDIELADGRMMDDEAPELILGYDYAELRGYNTGDELEIRGRKYDIVGILEKYGSEEDAGIITGLRTSQEILKKEDKVTIFMIKPIRADDAKPIADEINRLYDSISAGTDEDARKEAEEFMGQIGVMTFAMGSIAAIIAGLGIMNVMFMTVRERRKEIGTMKAIGATNYQILMEVVMEAVIIALIGAGIGILLSYLAVDVINTELGTAGIAMITPTLLINVTLFATFLGVIGGFLPARQAASLQPAVVLRYE